MAQRQAERAVLDNVVRFARSCTRIGRIGVVGAVLVACSASDSLAQGRFVYTDNQFPGSGSVAGFSVDARGALRKLPGSPFQTGGSANGFSLTQANSVVVSTVRNLLVATNLGSLDLSVFTLDRATGIPTLVPGGPTRVDPIDSEVGNALKVAVTPDGLLAIACVFSGERYALEVFRIGTDARLVAVPQSRRVGTGSCAGFSLSPDGRRIAVATPESGEIAMYRLDDTGLISLSSGSPYTLPPDFRPVGLEFTCSSDRLFATLWKDSRGFIGVFDITTEDRLVPAPGMPAPLGVGSEASELLLTLDGRFLYVSLSATNELLAFAVAADGGLAPVPGSPYRIDSYLDPLGLSTDETGRVLYLANGDAQVSTYTIRDDGTLATVVGSPFVTSGAPSNVTAIAAFPGKRCPGSPTLFVPPPPDVVTGSSSIENGRPGSFVSYSVPVVDAPCAPAVVTCSPPSGAFFAAGTSAVSCVASDACGNSGSCRFTVTVTSPFAGNAICLADDASGDRFSIVTKPEHALYGYWFYYRGSTGQYIAGKATALEERPGKSLTASDSGRNPPNVEYTMKARIRYDERTALVRVRHRETTTRFTLRVGDLTSQSPCE